MDGGDMKIIHVDDSRHALEEMKLELPQIVTEAELHSFERPRSALAFAEAHGCDVLLTEIELWADRRAGIRLAREITKRNPRVKIIFVTVYDKNEVACELFGLSDRGFLPKPWMPEKLAAAFQNLRCPIEPHTTM